VSNANKIPFLDLITPHQELEEELGAVFYDALRSGIFIGGPMVESLENEFATFCTTHYCVGVASGTDALRSALIASGVRRNDIVITVPNTFIATTEAISQAGAIPDFVDIDERTYTMDPEKLREYLETKCDMDDTTGTLINLHMGKPVTTVIPIHLYGHMVDMDPILALAEKYRVMVIEDACQAHGAKYHSQHTGKWEVAGSIGISAAFSFYPGKNLGALGEAGAVTTHSEEIAQKVKMLRDHGQLHKYYHEIEGYNGRLDAIQAGIVRVKLKHLAEWNEKRRKNAQYYSNLLKERDGVITPLEAAWSRSVYHLYVIRVKERDALRQFLDERNIATGLHYPLPLHLQRAYHHLGYSKGDFPIAEKVAKEVVSLPMYPELTCEQMDYIAKTIQKFLEREERLSLHTLNVRP